MYHHFFIKINTHFILFLFDFDLFYETMTWSEKGMCKEWFPYLAIQRYLWLFGITNASRYTYVLVYFWTENSFVPTCKPLYIFGLVYLGACEILPVRWKPYT